MFPLQTLPDDWKDTQVYDQSKVIALRILKEDADAHHSAVRAASRESYYSSSESITEEEALAYDAALVVSDTLTRLSRERPEVGIELFQDATSGQSSQCYSSPLVPYKHGQAIIELLKKTSVNGTTGQIMFDEQGQRVGYTVDVMELTARQKMQKEPPFLMYKNANDTSNEEDNLEGYCKDLIAKLMRAMGREYSIHLVKDNKYGTRDKSAQSGWNGMIGEILRKEADIAVAPLTITAERSRAVYFSEPFMKSGLAVLARRPEAESLSVFSLFSFLRPLSWEVWLCLLSAYVAVAVLLFVINRLNLAVATPPKEPPGSCSHLYNSLWYALGAFMSEECNNCRPKSVGSRLISFGWWFFVLVMLSMYTAQLWVNQPFKAPSPPVKDLKELAMQDKIEYGIVKDSATQQFFQCLPIVDMTVDVNSVVVVKIGHTATLTETLFEAVFVDGIGSLVALDAASHELTSYEFLATILAGDSDYRVLVVGPSRNTDVCPVTGLKIRLHALLLRVAQCGVERVTYTSTRDTFYSRMWDSMTSFNNTMTATNEEGVKRVRESEGNYAFIVDTVKIKYATQKAPCDLMQIGETFQPSGYGVVVSHKSPLNAAPLEVTKVGGWFVILGAGLLIAVAVAVAEVWCKSPPKPQKPKEPKEPKPKKEKKKKEKKDDEHIKEEGVETQLLQPGTNPSAYTGSYVGGADLTIQEVGEEDEDDEVVKVPIADVENLTDSADDSRDITRDVTADRIVPLAVNPLENHPEIKSIDHSPVESPKGGYESSEV
ncbi:hypothetical protein HPB51_012971 [Rhipicephalus microplus]|uniref:Glutamate receptor n=1 Tax=Rhipicephalus microplus TaxID=6941 RepID=A0A9J6F2Q9_RHIMP|nr:hypothetical protein HPB51_012971 [Rhipicephalus microplus]